MDLRDIQDFQQKIANVAEIAEQIITSPPEGMTEKQRAEYDSIVNNSEMGQQMKDGLSKLQAKREELEKLTKDFRNFSTK